MSKKKKYGGRRAYMKAQASDFINVTSRPRSLLLDETKSDTEDHWLNAPGRAQSTIGPKNNKLPKLNNTWTQSIPETKENIVDTPKKAVNKIIRKWTTEQHGVGRWGIDEFHFISIAKMGDWHLKLFFCSNTWLWVEENPPNEEGFVRRSDTYSSKQSAMLALKHRHIEWIDYQLLSTL